MTSFLLMLTIQCNYSFMGYPTTNVTVTMSQDGHFDRTASIDMQGRIHQESLTVETAASDELLHGWISKEMPDRAVEMIIYKNRQQNGDSRLINHNVPAGQEMWGTCTQTPQK